MKVGRIPYLSCEPFYFDMERRGIALSDVVPSAMAGAVAQGDIDAGPVPLADCFIAVEPSRCDAVAVVGRHSEHIDGAGVSFESVDFVPARHVPQSKSTIRAP